VTLSLASLATLALAAILLTLFWANLKKNASNMLGIICPLTCFFPLPFSRTNALSSEVFRFCSLVGRHFPTHFHVERNLRATFARAIYSGVSQHMNLAVRRMQLSVAARVRAPAIAPTSVLSPFVSLSRFRLVPRAPAKFSSSHALLIPRLSSILTDSLAASRKALRPGSEGLEDEAD
jgi:hypothetical protein